MAGNGRRASKATGEALQWDGVKRGPDLPATRPDGKEWLPFTKKYYMDFRVSPQAVKLGTSLDWYSVIDLCILKDNFYHHPSAVAAAEIRARENEFGITPLARHALKWDAPSTDDLGAGDNRDVNKVSEQRMLDLRRQQLG
ncbi:MAG: hypothetical protein J6575_03530 [Bifidobacterium sp.]|nr:hypothetical protein [Bifidobacterium sp.]